MVAWQDMLDDIEKRIDAKLPPALPDTERMLIRLIAELEEVAKGNATLDTFVENIGFIAKAVPIATIRRAASILFTHYVQLPPGFLFLYWIPFFDLACMRQGEA